MTTLSTRTLVRVGITTLALTLAACGGGGGSDGTDAADSATAALSQAKDCDDLLESIRADARAKIRVQADELREHGWSYSGIGRPTPIATASTPPTPTPAPPDAGPSRDAIDADARIPGIDEADVVGTDGEHLYLLHEGELIVLPAAPPENLTIDERLSIEGAPLGMFVAAEGRGVVLSSIIDGGSLDGDPVCEQIGPPFPRQSARPCSSRFVKVTLFDLSTSPVPVAREVYVEGDYVGARRHGHSARLIVQRAWGTPPGVGDPWRPLRSPLVTNEGAFVRQVDAWEESALAAIDASTLGQWLPTIRERVGDALVERPLDCTNTRVPALGEAPQGTTIILGFDLAADDAPIVGTTVLGLSAQLYANDDTLVLAYPDWQAAPFGESTTRTSLHLFGLPANAAPPVYRGSAFVPGELLRQSSIDVREEILRAATTYSRAQDGQNVARVHTMRIVDGTLPTIGATADIAPGGLMHHARFFSDYAYLASIFQNDPLYVVDLQNPRRPTVTGEVAIPGFYDYVHPLDDQHLLTISHGQFDSRTLQLFDVTDPTAPRLVGNYTVAEDSWTSPQWDHLASTFDEGLGLLALPLNARSFIGSVATLQLFAIDPETGIAPRGRVQHALPRTVACVPPFEDRSCASTETARRGIFVGDTVFSITDREIWARRAMNPEVHVARVSLP